MIGDGHVLFKHIVLIRFVRQELGDKPKLVLYGHSMGVAIAARAAAECAADSHTRVDGLILDSGGHNTNYDLSIAPWPTFYHSVSYIIDWQKLLEVADVEFNTAKVKCCCHFHQCIPECKNFTAKSLLLMLLFLCKHTISVATKC